MFIFILVLFTLPGMAQPQALLSGGMESGGYGGFFLKTGQLNGEIGLFMGGQGAWIINHRLGIGGKGYGLVNEVKIEGLENVKMEFGCWGGMLEYIMGSDAVVHVNLHSMIGAGSVRYAIMDYQDDHPEIDDSEDGFFVVEPGFDLILNMTRNFRIGAGATYRIVSGVDYADLTNADLNGFAGHVVFKFGVF